jgi:hypothetical protein
MPLKRTVLPYSERSRKSGGTTAVAGAAAPRSRYTEYGKTVPSQAAYLVEPAEISEDIVHAGLCRLSVRRDFVGELSDTQTPGDG